MVSYVLSGEPGSIRASAGKWATFSTQAGEAAADIRKIDSGDFIGDEADTYRDKMNTDLPPHLETTSQAWDIVGKALVAYADVLESLQSRMSKLAADASSQQSAVNSAQSSVSSAQAADSHHSQAQEAAKKALKPGESLPADTYHSQAAGASSQLSTAQTALQQTIDAANQVHADHQAAVRTCVSEIHRAKDMRFVEPPGFWGRLKNSVVGWIKDHADVLLQISSVLKTISGIAGLLAMIPVLAPIMGPIALATGAAALAIDVTVKLATGRGSWTGIIVDGALMALPGAGKLLKGAVGATKAGQAADRAAGAAVSAIKNSKVGAAYAAVRNSKAGAAVIGAPAKGLEYVNTKVAQGLAHVPGANKLPGVKAEFLSKAGANGLPSGKTTVYRVEGPGNARLAVDDAGVVTVTGQKMLFVTLGDEARAREFLAQRIGQGQADTVIKTVDVPNHYADSVRSRAVAEAQSGAAKPPIIKVDPTKTDNSFGLRKSEFPGFEQAIVPGSYREGI